jgi:HK97 family phage prohead protease
MPTLSAAQQGEEVVASLHRWRDNLRPKSREEWYRLENGWANSSLLRRMRGEDYAPAPIPSRISEPTSAVLHFRQCVFPAGRDVTLQGLAAPYGTCSRDRGGFVQKILPGAIRTPGPVRALLNHNDQAVFATTADGSLSLVQAAEGLRFCAKSPRGNSFFDLAVWLVQHRGWIECSTGYDALEDYWVLAQTPTQIDERVITRMNVREVSILSFAAFPSTRVSVVAPAVDPSPKPLRASSNGGWTYNPHVSPTANAWAKAWHDRQERKHDGKTERESMERQIETADYPVAGARSAHRDSAALSYARSLRKEIETLNGAIEIGLRDIRTGRGNVQTKKSIVQLYAKRRLLIRHAERQPFAAHILEDGPAQARDILKSILAGSSLPAAQEQAVAEIRAEIETPSMREISARIDRIDRELALHR